MLIAHYDQNTKAEQSLLEHSMNVAREAKRIGNDIKQGNIMFLIGILHDIGKADRLFQQKIKENPTLQVKHAYAGAKYIFHKVFELFPNNKILVKNKDKVPFFTEIVSYAIAAHHGVFDIPIMGERNVNNREQYEYSELRRRIYETDGYHFTEDVIPFVWELDDSLRIHGECSIEELLLLAFEEFCEVWEKIKKDTKEDELSFYAGLFSRLYISILKNVDTIDTINAFDSILKRKDTMDLTRNVNDYFLKIEKLYESLKKPTTEINKVRTNILERVIERGKVDQNGIYTLNLPTGAGKTNASVAYAINQMKFQGKKRFIYVAPFLSILEQNAAAMKIVLGEEGIFEHHSNVVAKEEDYSEKSEEESLLETYLMESWDDTVVLTTTVQFFNTLFQVKASNLRRFSNLIKSVIVLDEVQALPVEVTTLFNLTANFMRLVMKTSIVLCTATQPNLDSTVLPHRIKLGSDTGNSSNLCELSEEEGIFFQRNIITKINEEDEIVNISNVVDEVLREDKSTLIIVNTKKTVDKFYDEFKEKTNRKVYYLTTNLCAEHRKNVINNIKKDLSENLGIICVSTSLVEAGVDLDFHRVFRSYAGVDSIVQAAGRCNREGKVKNGIVQLMRLDNESENLAYLTSIQNKKKITETLLHNVKSPIDIIELNHIFYQKYYQNTKEKLLNFPVDKTMQTAFDMLSLNNDLGLPISRLPLKQTFKTAGNVIRLIKDDTVPIIVPYLGSEMLISELENILDSNLNPSGADWKFIKSSLRKLQRYTVNVREYSRAIELCKTYLENQILILPKEYYSEEKGIVLDNATLLI